MHMITVFSEDIEYVGIRLGECQNYSSRISEQILIDSGVNMKKDKLNLFQLLEILKKEKI